MRPTEGYLSCKRNRDHRTAARKTVCFRCLQDEIFLLRVIYELSKRNESGFSLFASNLLEESFQRYELFLETGKIRGSK